MNYPRQIGSLIQNEGDECLDSAADGGEGEINEHEEEEEGP